MADQDGIHNRVMRLERLSKLLDTAFTVPGTNISIGVDGLIGLIPGVGDLAGAAFSGYIVLEAFRMGVPTVVLLEMGFNILLETAIGTVPVAGDLFDIYFKANRRNVTLLKEYFRTRNLSE